MNEEIENLDGMDEIDFTSWSEAEKKEYLSDIEESPIFADNLDESKSGAFAALKSLKYDEMKPDELLEHYWHEANLNVKRGKDVHLTSALTDYDNALINAKLLEQNETISKLYANKAYVHILKGNYRKSINESENSLKYDENNLKAIWRAGNSYLHLNNPNETVKYCERGFIINPQSEALQKLKAEAVKTIERNLKLAKEKEERENFRTQKLKQVHEYYKQHHYLVGPPLFDDMKQYISDPTIENNELFFPFLLLYPEYSQIDFIQKVCETDTIISHLQVVLPDDSRCPWDIQNTYHVSNIEIFIMDYYTKPFALAEPGETDEKLRNHYMKQNWVRVNPNAKISDVLKYPKYSIPGIPIIHVIAKNTNYYKSFCEKNKDILEYNDNKTRTLKRCNYKECNKIEGLLEEFKKCAKCKKSFYCSKNCQEKDWKIHKKSCNKEVS